MKQKLLNCLIAFVMLLSTLSSYAQTVKITGTVTSDNGEQLPGASVVIVGTTKGTTTNSKGAFVIEVLATDKLKFSLIGFLSKEIVVGNQTNIDLILDFDDRYLDEVVVIGFGTQKKESVTGSIAVITSKDIERVHAGSTVSSGLAGKIAGVTFLCPL